MSECELAAGCRFFTDKMKSMPRTTAVLKEQYCNKDFLNCARYQLAKALGRPKVPPDLFPQHMNKAQVLIALG